ncbi:MAG: hypothetical protein A2542_01775 [Parcubacteria group bacterium RIFOXYD2_FULL_52_8]|nr:MAG: hypothetical protein A2542_01775 [Parcubacteria group bacterium RIFOXYD2_FULL_52_8]
MSAKPAPITIVIAAPLFPPDPGGPALHAAQYAEAFPGHAVRVRIVVFSKLLWLPFGIRHAVYLGQLFWAAIGTQMVYALDTNSTGWAAFMVAFVLRKKLLLRIGGDLLWERLAELGRINCSMQEYYLEGRHTRSLLYWTVKLALHRADRIIVPSIFLLQIYTQYYGVPEERFQVIPNPLPPKKDIGYVAAEQTILFASRLVPYKNIERMIRAAGKVAEKKSGVRLLVCGSGPEEQKLRDVIEREGLQQQVELRGLLPEAEVLQATQACLLTLAPALTEFHPNYVLRGIRYGKPFLISREHGLPFVIPEFMLCTPTDENDIAAKLEYLLSEEGYLKAKQWVATLDYTQSWDDVVRDNVTLIRELAAS